MRPATLDAKSMIVRKRKYRNDGKGVKNEVQDKAARVRWVACTAFLDVTCCLTEVCIVPCIYFSCAI